MNKTSGTSKDAADKLVRGIKRKTRKHYSAEEKIRIVLAGLRGEESIAALVAARGLQRACIYSWSKEFLEGVPGSRVKEPSVRVIRRPYFEPGDGQAASEFKRESDHCGSGGESASRLKVGEAKPSPKLGVACAILRRNGSWAHLTPSLRFAPMSAVLRSCRWHRRTPMTGTRTQLPLTRSGSHTNSNPKKLRAVRRPTLWWDVEGHP
jgi:transposase-like protein